MLNTLLLQQTAASAELLGYIHTHCIAVSSVSRHAEKHLGFFFCSANLPLNITPELAVQESVL